MASEVIQRLKMEKNLKYDKPTRRKWTEFECMFEELMACDSIKHHILGLLYKWEDGGGFDHATDLSEGLKEASTIILNKDTERMIEHGVWLTNIHTLIFCY